MIADDISAYDGISPVSNYSTTWQDVVKSIKNGSFAKQIAKARSLVDLEEYRKYKQTLPAVTFCGKFDSPRNIQNVISTTGFIIADIDHISDVDGLFDAVCNDPYVWFVFRSPSGNGIKAGLRHQNIRCDSDIKSFYASMENYFKEVYGVKTDKSCKDICRLTFLSYDPLTYINAAAEYFPIEDWVPVIKETPVQQSRRETKDRKVRYAQRVVENCCAKIRTSPPGQQHDFRVAQSRLAGGFAHYLDEDTVWCALEQAVEESGAKDMIKAMKDIKWGLSQGMAQPLEVPDMVSNATSNENNDYNAEERFVTDRNGGVTGESCSGNDSSGFGNGVAADKRPRYQGVLAHDVEEWLVNRTGCVTKREIWDEFGLVHPLDKANLRKIVHTLIKREYIYKDRYKADTYWIKEGEFQYDDLDAADEADSGLRLPLNLHELMTVPRGSVFLLEGCTNAGKTAFCFNVLRANFSTEIPLRYIYSEGGKSEVALRVSSFVTVMGDDRDAWKNNLKTAFFPNNHHQFILQQNPTGLTVVDYVRAVDGDFTKMGPAIDLIAESAGQGFVMVCVQKKTGNAYGVGGQNNHFAPRNVFSLDFVCKDNGYDFCVLTIKKCKYPRDFLNNPDGKEIHLAIRGGVELTQLCKPMFCDEANRKKLFAQYRQNMFGNSSSMVNMERPF